MNHEIPKTEVEQPAVVQIDIRLPKLPTPNLSKVAQLRPPALPYKRVAIGVAVCALLLVAGSVGKGIIAKPGAGQAASISGSSVRPATAALAKPSFMPLIPADKPQLASSGTFDGSRDSYSYQDVLQGTTMAVSQQPVPSNMGSADTALTTIAKKLSASTTIPTSDGLAYTASDPKSGMQTIVYIKHKILVLIQSPIHASDSWTFYLNNLK